MAFLDFLAAIQSPELRAIAVHWNDARGTRPMPGWSNIDPVIVAPYLPIIWSWKYDRGQDSFTGRLAGERITDALGANLRGRRMQDFFPDTWYPSIFLRGRRVVTEPAFAREHGAVLLHANRYNLGERIIMPLAGDGINADGILGATIYSIDHNAPLPDTTADRYQEAMQSDFFAIG